MYEFPENSQEQRVLECIKQVNSMDHVDGLIVQLPLPASMNPGKLLENISKEKDVDGLHPLNLGELARTGQFIRKVKCLPFHF